MDPDVYRGLPAKTIEDIAEHPQALLSTAFGVDPDQLSGEQPFWTPYQGRRGEAEKYQERVVIPFKPLYEFLDDAQYGLQDHSSIVVVGPASGIEVAALLALSGEEPLPAYDVVVADDRSFVLHSTLRNVGAHNLERLSSASAIAPQTPSFDALLGIDSYRTKEWNAATTGLRRWLRARQYTGYKPNPRMHREIKQRLRALDPVRQQELWDDSRRRKHGEP